MRHRHWRLSLIGWGLIFTLLLSACAATNRPPEAEPALGNLQEERFVRLTLFEREAVLKIELINDVPARVGRIRQHPVLGRLDSPENILANKVTALIDREEPKDLADIWGFCCSMNLSLADALVGARGKAAGIFPVDLARILLSATRADWEQIRWVDAPAAERFLADLQALGESLVLVQ